jgi:CRP-like cAMP-binding protein
MFYLLDGRVRVCEIKTEIGPGHFLGEIGVFASDRRRTATVECLTDCVVLELTNAKARDIFFQNPTFGYAVLHTIISRLSENAQAKDREADNKNIIRLRPDELHEHPDLNDSSGRLAGPSAVAVFNRGLRTPHGAAT